MLDRDTLDAIVDCHREGLPPHRIAADLQLPLHEIVRALRRRNLLDAPSDPQPATDGRDVEDDAAALIEERLPAPSKRPALARETSPRRQTTPAAPAAARPAPTSSGLPARVVDDLAHRYQHGGQTLRGLAAATGIPAGTIRHALVAAGVDLRPPGRQPSVGSLGNASWLQDQADRGVSPVELAGTLGIDRRTIDNAYRRAGITPASAPAKPKGRAKHAQLADGAWLQAQVDAGSSVADIAAEVGCSLGAVRGAFRRNDVTPPGRRPTYPQLHDTAWLAAQADAGRSVADIAGEVGCASTTVQGAYRRAGMTPPNPPRYPQLADPQWLQAQADAGCSVADIAADVGCGEAWVRTAYRRAGLTPPRRANGFPQLADPDWLQAQADVGRSLAEIADELGAVRATVTAAYRRAGLPGPVTVRLPDELRDHERLREYAAMPGTVAELAATLEVTARVVLEAYRWAQIPPPSRNTPHPRLSDPDWLADQAAAGISLRELADDLGCTAIVIANAYRDAGLRPPPRIRPSGPLADPTWLADTHQTRTITEIAADLGVHRRQVTAAFNTAGVAIRDDLTVRLERGEQLHGADRLRDAAWLRRRYEHDLASTGTIAAELEVSPGTVARWLREHDIDVRPRKTQYPALYYRHLLAPYMDGHGTREDIADRIAADVGCSRSAAEDALRAHFGPPQPRTPRALQDRDLLARLYATHSAAEIARRLGVGETSVLRWLSVHGIERRAVGQKRARPSKSRYPQLNDRDWLAAAYASRSAADIAVEVGCSEPAVLSAVRRHSLQVRAPGARAA